MSSDRCHDCSVESLGLGGRGAHLAIPALIAPVMGCCLVANRVYWRIRVVGALGLDDYSAIFALGFLVIQCGASIAAVDFGYGRAFETLNRDQASQALRCFFLVQIFYKLTMNCTKLSLLFLYLRIFTDRVWFARACRGLIGLVLCACVCFTMATILQCSPVNGVWERWRVSTSCINIYALWYSNAIYNILTDVVIALIVPPVIFTLKLPMRQKMALCCIFGLGIFVCAASIFRLTTLYSSAYGSDITAGSLTSTIWTTIEAGLGVICTNLPMLRTPLQHFFPRIFPSRTRSDRVSPTSTSRPSGLASSGSLNSPLASDEGTASNSMGGMPYQVRVPGLNVSSPRSVPVHQHSQKEVRQSVTARYFAEVSELEAQEHRFGDFPSHHADSHQIGQVNWFDTRHNAW